MEDCRAKRLVLVAAAGHGKTQSVCKLVEVREGRSLVLTHTRAGVKALRERFRANNIPASKCAVQTIAGFCETWAKSYPWASGYAGIASMKRVDSDGYYRKLYELASPLLGMDFAQAVMRRSYSLVVVDEYQDCTAAQGELIEAAARDLDLVVLGDPLQAIFYWEDDELVDWGSLHYERGELENDRPWRWINHGTPELGEVIASIREKLMPALDGTPVTLSIPWMPGVIDKIAPDDLKDSRRLNLSSDEDTLYLAKFEWKQRDFAKNHRQFQMNEKVERSHLREHAASICANNGPAMCLALFSFASSCMTAVNSEFKTHIKQLGKPEPNFSRITKHKAINEWLTNILDGRNCYANAAKVLEYCASSQTGTRVYRKHCLHDMMRLMKAAAANGCSLVETLDDESLCPVSSLELEGNYKYMSSRPVLSKGLECDHAIIDMTDPLTDPRDFYVAVSRAKKHVSIVCDRDIFTFSMTSKRSCG